MIIFMNKIRKKRSIKSGLPPGSLIFTGEQKSERIQIKLFTYTEDSFEEKVVDLNDVSFLSPEKSFIHWINVEGIHDVKTIEKLGSCFGIHPLVLEDILNTGQRPKIENYERYTYIVVKMLFYDNKLEEFTTEQESFILGENYVISFSERKVEIYLLSP